MSKCLSRLALVSVAALGTALFASSASAQDYPYPPGPNYAPPPSYAPPGPNYAPGYGDEEVIIHAPRHRPERSDIGAPIEDVAISREVRFDDLDLSTRWGVRELRERIAFTARTMCNQLDQMYPVATGDSPPCFRTAVEDAMAQAQPAIEAARGYAYRPYDGYDDGTP